MLRIQGLHATKSDQVSGTRRTGCTYLRHEARGPGAPQPTFPRLLYFRKAAEPLKGGRPTLCKQRVSEGLWGPPSSLGRHAWSPAVYSGGAPLNPQERDSGLTHGASVSVPSQNRATKKVCLLLATLLHLLI